MTHLVSVRIGRCTVRVTAEGCPGCGARWSAKWHAAESVEVTIGRRRQTLDLYRCDECHAGKPRPAELGPARERAASPQGQRDNKPTLPDGAGGREFGG